MKEYVQINNLPDVFGHAWTETDPVPGKQYPKPKLTKKQQRQLKSRAKKLDKAIQEIEDKFGIGAIKKGKSINQCN